MIADLHCHYPMHLVSEEPDPGGPDEGWLRKLLDGFEGDIVELVAKVVNDSGWGTGWRVRSVDDLRAGGTDIVCSVLYWPASEFDFARVNDAPPLEDYFDYLQRQLEFVETDVLASNTDATPVLIARTVADLSKPGMRFVHCVEGGFQLGEDPGKFDERVQWLSQRGVLYITVAHLFYRQVATEAPAIPMFPTDRDFLNTFDEPADVGLTDRGVKLIEAMYRHKVLVDVSHMSERAIAETFALIERLEGDSPKTDYPVIATHVGLRSVAGTAKAQEYNLSDDTVRKIADRGGAVGLIAAQHQLGETGNPEDSAKVVKAHLDAIEAAVGDASTVAALGTDIDGFIKPTLAGFERATDGPKLEQWVLDANQTEPEAILHGNAERVIRAAFKDR